MHSCANYQVSTYETCTVRVFPHKWHLWFINADTIHTCTPMGRYITQWLPWVQKFYRVLQPKICLLHSELLKFCVNYRGCCSCFKIFHILLIISYSDLKDQAGRSYMSKQFMDVWHASLLCDIHAENWITFRRYIAPIQIKQCHWPAVMDLYTLPIDVQVCMVTVS